MLKQVYYPRHITEAGITKNHKGTEADWSVGAFDTETVNGIPNTIQFSFNGREAVVCKVTPDDIFDVFLFHVREWASRKGVNVLYAHNLKFDLQSILWRPDHREFFGKERRDFIVPIIRKDGRDPMEHVESDGDHKADDLFAAYLHCFTDKTWFARLKLSDRRRVHLIDTNAFFKMSLDEAAKMIGSPVEKLERPKDLGTRSLIVHPDLAAYAMREMTRYKKECRKTRTKIDRAVVKGLAALTKRPTNKESVAFTMYAHDDARAQWYVGQAVHDLHVEHDVRVSVSLPQLAARILRHRFFREGDAISFPPINLVRALELSYHGGKNQMKRNPDGSWAAGYYKDVWEVDINSAYTAAMVDLPSMLKGTWKDVDTFVAGSHGVYCISGEVNCPYGCVFTHDFRRIEGPFRDIWITSYELESGLKTGCIRLTKCYGHIWKATSRYSPLREFGQNFWDEKARWTAIEGKRGFHTLMSKLYPNSTYGKMISTIWDPDASEVSIDEDFNIETEKVYRACGLYNPAIATFITGRVRGTYLHTHEHAWQSIHSSTDSIKTLMDPTGHPSIGKALGQWSVEIRGNCCLLRPKLYIHESADEVVRDRDTNEIVMDLRTGQPKKKMKEARHGFGGTVKDLLDAADYDHAGKDSPVLTGRAYEYTTTKVWSARESLIRTSRRVVPLNFERVPKSLKSVLGLGPRIASGL